MKWGDHIEFLERVVAPELAKNGKVPKALASRPAVEPQLLFIWDAYLSLERDRQSTGLDGPGPISFIAINAYADRYGIDDIWSFDRFRRLIMAMDSAYLRYVADEIKRGQKK